MFRMLRFVWDMFVSHKVRFLLTISGVVVGVASLVTLASLLHVGEGILRATSMQASGEDIVNVSNDWRARQKYPNEKRLDSADLENLQRSSLLTDTQYSAVYGMGPAKIVVGAETLDARGVGVDQPAFEVHDLKFAAGRPFNPDEYVVATRVAVVGSRVKEKLPVIEVGTSITVNGVILQVVGIMEKRPQMGPGEEWSWNNRVIVPARTYNLYFSAERRPNTIVGKVSPPATWEGVLEQYVGGVRQITRLVLMTRRSYDIFDLGNSKEEGGTEQIIFLTIKILIFLTTVFSMLVGGINIMNIMLVTVTERTREIGIRRALGATRRDILRQFLAETLGVTLTGAAIGTLGALGALWLASVLLTKFFQPWPFYVATWSLGLGLGFSMVIGIVFGLSPAVRASRLDPVEALRYE